MRIGAGHCKEHDAHLRRAREALEDERRQLAAQKSSARQAPGCGAAPELSKTG